MKRLAFVRDLALLGMCAIVLPGCPQPGTGGDNGNLTGTPAPTARDDTYPASGNLSSSPLIVSAAEGVLANDTTTSPAAVTASDTITTAGGTVAVSATGGFTYIPPSSLNADDTFTYTVTDPGGSAKATVRIHVALQGAAVASGSTGLGNDTLIGDASTQTIDGDVQTSTVSLASTGNDIIVGSDIVDSLAGDIRFNSVGVTVTRMGDDIISGGAGDDSIFGDGVINNGTVVRAGDDTLNGGDGVDQIAGDFQIVSPTGVVTTCGNDLLFGGNQDDTLVGDVFVQNGTVTNMGNDTLKGGDGNDALYGDTVTTNGTVTKYGDDVLEGGAGDDILFGDSESITTGGGADAFVFSIAAAFGDDRIRDYRKSEGDVIRFTGVTDANSDGSLTRADLDALVSFTVQSSGGNVQVVLTSKASATVIGTITFTNLAFAGQTFDSLPLTIQVGA